MSMRGKRLLGVFAHPDDECYGPGGAIAHYAIQGVEVWILMYTCGEAGSIGVSSELPRDELCRLRTGELAASCDALGVARHRIVGAPDKKVETMDEESAVEEILDDIAAFRPHVLMTFHHRGVSSHPDHIAVACFLERAFDATARRGEKGDGPVKLYQWGIPEEKARLYERPNLVTTPIDEVHARITPSDEAMDRKIEAIKCHQTQYDFYLSLSEKFDYRKDSSPECFTLRKSTLRHPDGVETDLFAGVD
ncbi:MAG: PIG-L family deacetylase [Candidatus Krumholzibacteriota bacterium]|nr:PIG-L family deacetylase [Candidatus Krumholzibacteriota bacterium]